MAEQGAGLPPGLLLAVGKVESGRVHPVTGQVVPWPYAVNVGGRGLYPDSAQEAATIVLAAQAQGTFSIDVGCFQVNLLHHPGAFPTLADGFDPSRNGAYAARFLAGLRSRLPGWDLAAGAYHSGTPELAGPYAASVMSAWSGGNAGAAAALGQQAAPAGALSPAQVQAGWTEAALAGPAWAQRGAGRAGPQPGAGMPGLVQAILFRPAAARRVRVFAPGAGAATPVAGSAFAARGYLTPASLAPSEPRVRLPVVYSPTRR